MNKFYVIAAVVFVIGVIMLIVGIVSHQKDKSYWMWLFGPGAAIMGIGIGMVCGEFYIQYTDGKERLQRLEEEKALLVE